MIWLKKNIDIEIVGNRGFEEKSLGLALFRPDCSTGPVLLQEVDCKVLMQILRKKIVIVLVIAVTQSLNVNLFDQMYMLVLRV